MAWDEETVRRCAGEGKSQVPIIRESGSRFKVYCTGRRHCKALEATLDLRVRQDLFAQLLGLVFPWDDKVELEVFMHETSMPQIVLAIANKKLMKQMLKEEEGEDGAPPLAFVAGESPSVGTCTPKELHYIHPKHLSQGTDTGLER